MTAPGPNNLITDISGLKVGNATDVKAGTGVTVLRCAKSFVASVDVRGGAPGSRETDVLSPENLVGRADAIVLTGGSVFGLAAADGVVNYLSRNEVGLRISEKGPAIPIVPAAVLHDLGNEGDKDWFTDEWGNEPPYRALGEEATKTAETVFSLGSHGAGRGAMAGAVKGGLGSASIVLEEGYAVGALVAANPVGSVFMPDGKTFYAWPWEQNDEFGGAAPDGSKDTPDPFPDYSRLKQRAKAGANTTIAVVATDAALTDIEAKRVAMMAHDGIARAVRPAHSPFDGDIVFSVATEEKPMPDADALLRSAITARIGAAAADCLARAIARAVYEAAR